MNRYQVFGYYTDEPQVVLDIVDAETAGEAERLITEARGGERSDYTSDGAELLTDAIETLQKALAQSPDETAKGIAELRDQYAHYHEDDDEDDDEAPCPECERSHGPHYAGPCDH